MVKLCVPKSKISGHYWLNRINAVTGKITGQWAFCNLVTNNGLNLWGTASNRYNTCIVGSGSSVPVPENTQLDAPIASTSTVTKSTGFNSSGQRYGWSRFQYQFGAGAAAGNVSEIGVGVTANNLFSRALVLDANGNPTSITILSDEILQVVYEVRHLVPMEDFSGTFTLTGNAGGTYDYVGRAARATTRTYWNPEAESGYRGANNSMFYLSTGAIGDITGTPVYGAGGSSGGSAAYVQDSFSRSITTSFNLGSGNQTSNSLGLVMGGGAYQFEFDPPIVKNNTQQLSIVTSHSWGRA